MRVDSLFSHFLEDESGQGVTEYVLILGVATVAAGFMMRQILRVFDLGILKLGGQLEKDLKSGRASLGSWKN